MTKKLSSKDLFESNGLGNEINFHVFDYDPEDEYIVRGNANIEKVLEEVDLEDEFEVNSVNGWVIQQFGKIPKVGESFEYKNLKIVIQKATKRCVLEIRITVDEPMEISS